MKHWVASIVFSTLLVTQAFGAAKGPEIRVVDSKISIDVESISLSRLLQLFDRATGLQSTVPPTLSNRTLSVKFVDLTFDEAVRKIFEGQPLDYVVIERQGIVVTALSQMGGPEAAPMPVFNQAPSQIEQPSFIEDNQQQPFAQPQPQVPVGAPIPVVPGAQNPGFNQQTQPAVIQTPFGPIPNPRAGQPIPGAPNQMPGQATPYGTTTPFGTAAPATPFGGGQPPANQNNNNIFGNTSPPLFNQNQK